MVKNPTGADSPNPLVQHGGACAFRFALVTVSEVAPCRRRTCNRAIVRESPSPAAPPSSTTRREEVLDVIEACAFDVARAPALDTVCANQYARGLGPDMASLVVVARPYRSQNRDFRRHHRGNGSVAIARDWLTTVNATTAP
jgi:hypothetical protein